MNSLDISPAQEAEINHCAQDFVYFCETYIKIVHPTRGLIPFKLYDFQKRYVEAMGDHRFLIAVKFRQGGFTTTTLAWFLWRVIFKLDEHNMVMSGSDRIATSCCDTVRNFILHLPKFLKPNLSKCNSHELRNEDNRSVLFFHTPVAACGRSINYLFIDEAAFINDMVAHWKAMWPCLSCGGNCIALSTPSKKNKNNWFYQMYMDAIANKTQFHAFQCSYLEHPDFNNDQWANQMKQNLGELGWRQEILCEFLDEPFTKENKTEEVIEDSYWTDHGYAFNVWDDKKKDEPKSSEKKLPEPHNIMRGKVQLNPEEYFFLAKTPKEEQEILENVVSERPDKCECSYQFCSRLL